MAKKSKTEQQLLDFLGERGIEVKEGRNRQQYLEALKRHGEEITDDEWSKVPAAAQDWLNEAVKAWDKHRDIPDFPADAEEPSTPPAAAEARVADAEAVVEEDTDEKEDRRPAKKAEKAAPTKTAAKTPAKPAPKVTAKAAHAERAIDNDEQKSTGILKRVFQIVLDNPSIKTDELVKQLESEGRQFSKHTLSTTKNNFLSAMRFLAEEGKLKDVKLAA